MIIKIGLFVITLSMIFLKAFGKIDMSWGMIFSPLWIGIPTVELSKWIIWRLWKGEYKNGS